MQISFLTQIDTWQLMLILMALMIISILIGLYTGNKFYKESKVDSTILGALFTLLGLILAFTFSMAIEYHGIRRDIIVEEANDIGTAILRADLYRESDRNLFRAEFKKYVDARIDYFAAGADLDKIKAAQKFSAEIQQQLWNHASQFSKDSGYSIASMQMIPALNTMIDVTTSRQYSEV